MAIECRGAAAVTKDFLNSVICDTGALIRDYGTPKETLIGATQGDISIDLGITYRDIEHNKGTGAPYKGTKKVDSIQPTINFQMLENNFINLSNITAFSTDSVAAGKSVTQVPFEILGTADGTTDAFPLAQYDPNQLCVWLVNPALVDPKTGAPYCEEVTCYTVEQDETAQTAQIIFNANSVPAAPYEVVASYWHEAETPEGEADCRILTLKDFVSDCDYWKNVALRVPLTFDPKSGVILPEEKCFLTIILNCVMPEIDSGWTFSDGSETTTSLTLTSFRDPCAPCAPPIQIILPCIQSDNFCCPANTVINPLEGPVKKAAA